MATAATTRDKITAQELRFERVLDAPVETVWRYLVESELREKWFMGGGIDARVGGDLEFVFDHSKLSDEPVPTPEKYAPHVGSRWSEKITRIEPPHLIAFTWSEGKAGEVTIELSEAGDKTRLILTHSGLRGPDDAKNYGAGWTSHLAVLEARIAGKPVPDFWALHRDNEEAVAKQVG